MILHLQVENITSTTVSVLFLDHSRKLNYGYSMPEYFHQKSEKIYHAWYIPLMSYNYLRYNNLLGMITTINVWHLPYTFIIAAEDFRHALSIYVSISNTKNSAKWHKEKRSLKIVLAPVTFYSVTFLLLVLFLLWIDLLNFYLVICFYTKLVGKGWD